jgi:hypothetical protein
MLKKELFQVIEAFHTMLFDPLLRKMTSIRTIQRQSAYVNEKENEKTPIYLSNKITDFEYVFKI